MVMGEKGFPTLTPISLTHSEDPPIYGCADMADVPPRATDPYTNISELDFPAKLPVLWTRGSCGGIPPSFAWAELSRILLDRG